MLIYSFEKSSFRFTDITIRTPRTTKLLKIPYEDPTFRRLSSLQQYLRKLKELKELSEEIYQRIRPQSGRLVRAHNFCKSAEFVNLPKF